MPPKSRTAGGAKNWTVTIRVKEDVGGLQTGAGASCIILSDMTLYGNLLDTKPWQVMSVDTATKTFTINFSFERSLII